HFVLALDQVSTARNQTGDRTNIGLGAFHLCLQESSACWVATPKIEFNPNQTGLKGGDARANAKTCFEVNCFGYGLLPLTTEEFTRASLGISSAPFDAISFSALSPSSG